MAYAALGLGILGGAAGAFLGGQAGDIKRSRLRSVAETPGLDTGAITGQALADQLKYLPQAQQLQGQIGQANQAEALKEWAQIDPALLGNLQAASGKIGGLFGDSSAALADVARRGAAAGLTAGGRGYAGSTAGQIGNLRLSYQEDLARTQLGTGLLGSLIGSMSHLKTTSPGVQAFMGPSPEQLINLRAGERTQRMNLLAQAAGVPGQTAAWGGYLSGLGGMATGAGLLGVSGALNKPSTLANDGQSF